MAEDVGLCTNVRHHKKKLILFLSAMRNYADALRHAGFEVRYHALEEDDERSYEEKLSADLRDSGATRLRRFEIEDAFMEERISRWTQSCGIETTVATTPMFLCERERFAEFLDGPESPRMADFYQSERRRLGILVEADGSPRGGRWSFDADNRRKLPSDIEPPDPLDLGEQAHVDTVRALVEERFADHPGSADAFSWPVTREAALAWLDDFLGRRLAGFGPYEDAISRRSRTIFHSLLSSSLNLGLITPREVIDRTRSHEGDVPIESLEGFVRQIIGWREFIRGIYHCFGREQEKRNFWGHERRLTESWYSGETGIPPLDDAIRGAWELGWDHHIVRLMIVGNLMTLSEIEPRQAHRWFMEMYLDALDWVMGPNVYGMALYSDGGIFATKPYICGSNYLLKMSDYGRGDWCDTVDGLYWRFIDKHRDFFSSNPRLAMMPRTLERLDPDRRSRILTAAEAFLETHTRS